jgi:glycosyltransferase involved in cell wall biosynthesis
MSKRNKPRKAPANAPSPAKGPPAGEGVRSLYDRACSLAAAGKPDEARALHEDLAGRVGDPRLRALLANDRAALAALSGNLHAARGGFREALSLHPGCEPARLNLALVEADLACPPPEPERAPAIPDPVVAGEPSGPVKVAVVSFLFNWPSTGGGIIHTVELARFLAEARYEVKHFHARHDPWEVGRVDQPLPFASEALEFDEAGWNTPNIQARFRAAVEAFAPDFAVVTDSWNVKPLLADALGGLPGVRVLLRLQAMECLCPLNNVRLLPEPGGRAGQCPLDQLSSPEGCSDCLRDRGHLSGSLHRAERALSGVGSPEYREALLRSFRAAEAVLAVNPLTEGLVRPFARDVRVVTSGMDPARFPWPWPEGPAPWEKEGLTVFFAGLAPEWMKGFHVLHEACALLWRKRRDFRLLATADPPGRVDDFTRFVGWQSQGALPAHLRAADVVVLPTVAQEALGRTAVEAMGVGRAVVASRLGGLPATVVEGVTGLLAEPGDPVDLAAKIETLLDDPDLRERMGLAGRRRFEGYYSWPVVIGRHYKPLLGPPDRSGGPAVRPLASEEEKAP